MDLVNRLRDGAVSPYVAWTPENQLRREAANEIERLREAMQQMREDFRRIEMLAEQHCPADASVKR